MLCLHLKTNQLSGYSCLFSSNLNVRDVWVCQRRSCPSQTQPEKALPFFTSIWTSDPYRTPQTHWWFVCDCWPDFHFYFESPQFGEPPSRAFSWLASSLAALSPDSYHFCFSLYREYSAFFVKIVFKSYLALTSLSTHKLLGFSLYSFSSPFSSHLDICNLSSFF